MREYPDHIALRLLQMHRETAVEVDAEMPPVDLDELRERIVSKLQRMKKRDEEQEAGFARLRGAAPRDGDHGESDAGGAADGD